MALTSTAGVALSAMLVFTVPLLVAFVFGPVTDDVHNEEPIYHVIRFFILGILLFLPVLVITMNALGKQQGTLVGGEALGLWFGTGVVIYWITYVAGTSMRRIWDM